MKPLLRRPDPHGVPANQPGRLAPGVVSRFPYTFVFDLLVRLRPPSGSKVQESPHRIGSKRSPRATGPKRGVYWSAAREPCDSTTTPGAGPPARATALRARTAAR